MFLWVSEKRKIMNANKENVLNEISRYTGVVCKDYAETRMSRGNPEDKLAANAILMVATIIAERGVFNDSGEFDIMPATATLRRARPAKRTRKAS